MIRKASTIAALLLAALFASNARADSITAYGINFVILLDELNPTIPPSGSFLYDNTTNQFTAFSVLWDGFSFDLTSSANSPYLFNGGPRCISGYTGPQATLALMTTCTGDLYLEWGGANGINGGSGFPSFKISDDEVDTEVVDTRVVLTDRDIFIYAAGPQERNSVPSAETFGSFTSSVVTPEPATEVLLLVGIGIVLVLRKRIAPSQQEGA